MFKQISLAATVAFIFGILAATALITVSDVEAKGFSSSRSFSRSSFRSSSFSRSSSRSSRSLFSTRKSVTKTKATRTASKKYTTNGKTASSQKFTGKKHAYGFKTVASGKQTRQAKTALRSQQSKFKKRPTVNNGTNAYASKSSSVRSRYSNRGVYSRASHYDRSTYYTRRNSYYLGYTTPSYVYGAYPSYGMWDTLFLYSLLNNNNNSAQFAYNHQNDADYKEWRRDADRLAQSNAELRAQLAQMDAGSAKMTGAINPDYIPKGVDADIAMSQEVLAAQKPTMRVCVGSKNGTYFRVAAGVLMQDINSVNVVPVLTAGTGEILEDITNGKCDAAFVQGDGYWNYVEDHKTAVLPFERVASPYKEAVHLFCNADGPSEISDLTKSNTVWFPAKSGAAVTWRNFVGENSDYRKIKIGTVDSYEEAIMKVRNDKNSCALYVGAPGASKFVRSIDAAAVKSNIVLVDVDDGDLNDTTDPSGKDVYKFGDIEQYKQLGRQNSCYGYCSGDIDTVFVNADFIVANNWKKANKATYSTFALDLMAVQPDIEKAVHF